MNIKTPSPGVFYFMAKKRAEIEILARFNPISYEKPNYLRKERR